MAVRESMFRGRENCRKLRKGKRNAIALLCVVSLIAASAALAGCKNSDVLNELIHDQDNGKLDETLDPWYKESPTAPPDPTKDSKYQSENENLAEQQQTKTVYSETPNEPEQQTEQREQQVSNTTYEATQGQQEGTQGASPQIASNADGNGGGGTDTSQQPTGGKGGTVTDIDNTGASQDVPRNVSTVAAQNNEATIVEMLCGSGALVAANESWATTMKSKGAFSNDAVEFASLDQVASGWTDDGTPNLAALVAAAPNVIIEEAGTRQLTEDEKAAMAEQGVSCTVMTVNKLGESTTSDSAIVSNVQLIGEMMQDAYPNAQSMASSYKQMHDEAINNCTSANGGYAYKTIGGSSSQAIYQGDGADTTNFSSNRVATAVVDSWYDVSATVSSERTYNNASMSYLSKDTDTLAVSGVALSMGSDAALDYILSDYYLQCAGVVNEAYEYGKPDSTKPTLIAAGSCSLAGLDNLITKRSVPSALWFCETSATGNSANWTTVGDSAFPAVIVRSQSIADSIIASAGTANGFYNVGQSYGVYVVPSGLMGSWLEGTPESYLLVPWAYCAFHASNGSIDLSTCTTYVDNFYKTFYRCAAGSVVTDYSDGIRTATAG